MKGDGVSSLIACGLIGRNDVRHPTWDQLNPTKGDGGYALIACGLIGRYKFRQVQPWD